MPVSFDRVADIYDRTRGLPPYIMKKVVAALANELKGYRTVLDAGVGTGRYAKPLQNKVFRLVGIDISERMLEKAHLKGVKNLHLADVCHLPFRDLSFDATICNHVLHLVEDWKTALTQITRVTRHVLVSTTYGSPNPIHETYEELLRKHGYARRKLGISEAELKGFVKPTRTIAAVAKLPVSADKTISMLEEKAYSYQWNIPNNLNRLIITDLKARFEGKIYHRDIQILVWKAEALKQHLSSSDK